MVHFGANLSYNLEKSLVYFDFNKRTAANKTNLGLEEELEVSV
jgi:hypothetical protein